jgi:hypothetical protein
MLVFLKVSGISCAFLLVSLSVFAVDQSSKTSTPVLGQTGGLPQKQAEGRTQETQSNKTSAPNSVPSPAQTNTPQRQAESASVSDAKNDKATTDTWLMIFTGVLAVVALLQLATFIWQVCTARSTAEKELRAYVYPSSVKRFRENGVMKVRIVFINSGKTPAHNCVHRLVEAFPPAMEHFAFPLPDADPEKQSKYALAPAGEINMLVDAVEPPRAEHELIESGIRSLYLYGEIQYRDVFNKQRCSRFRFESSGRNFDSGLFNACADGNEGT